VDESKAEQALIKLNVVPYKEPELVSPAQAEKELKKSKLTLPDDLVVSVSSGTTLASADDPRPAVLQISSHLRGAFFKLQ
jgi:hypothetical protein